MKNTNSNNSETRNIHQDNISNGTTASNFDANATKTKVPAGTRFRMHPLQVWASPYFLHHPTPLNEKEA